MLINTHNLIINIYYLLRNIYQKRLLKMLLIARYLLLAIYCLLFTCLEEISPALRREGGGEEANELRTPRVTDSGEQSLEEVQLRWWKGSK